ncbi:putative lipid II flippase FtsW [Candidatus Gracilibacteria bacterium]|nr:putative lipid II flippase FtsW [Candidatus Gracilibacteria bacterium]MCF7819747.1 putative lipid II flippase FtsW [Candidatus Gracilibacteria bacterium]
MQNIDKGLFFTVAGLTIFGLIMMSSISIAGSFEVTGQNDFYFWRHFWHVLIGIPIFLVAFKFPIEKLKKLSVLLFLISLILLILTLTIGESYGTAARSWLPIGPFSFQPVELIKLTVIIFLSALFASGKSNPSTLEGGFVPFVVVMSIPAILIVAQPDFGSLLVLILISAAVYFSAGANLKHFFGGMGIFFAGFGIITLTTPYILHRVKVFLDPSLDPLNTGFQVKQALIAIGSGGIFGRGFQNSIQKFDYLPEVQSDTIFAAIAEEMGFLRILILIGAYFYIGYRGYQIAKNAQDHFSKLLAVGITTWIVGQAFINIAVNLALLPNTGITLPLISYGGSSMLLILASVGILLQISGQSHQQKKRHYYH